MGIVTAWNQRNSDAMQRSRIARKLGKRTFLMFALSEGPNDWRLEMSRSSAMVKSDLEVMSSRRGMLWMHVMQRQTRDKLGVG